MSRIGKLPVVFSANIKVVLKDNKILVEGPKGSLEKEFDLNFVIIAIEGGSIQVSARNNSRFANAYCGTVRSIINNMVQGVLNGYKIDLELHGVGFKAIMKGDTLVLNLGYSHDIQYKLPYAGVQVTVADNTKIKIEGADKHAVGQIAADIYHFYKVEPYKGKGVRYVGQFILRKEGKKTA